MRRKTAAVVGWSLGVVFAVLVGCGGPQGEVDGSTGEARDLDTRRAALTKQTLTLGALADTHVVATAPGTSYGSSATLEVDLAPESETYLKFVLPDLAGTVTSARLRLYALDGSSDGPTVYDPPGVREWNESDTWNTRPDCCDYWAVASAGPVTSGTWMELDVSRVYFYDNGAINFYLAEDSTDGVTLASSEHPDAALRPQLILTVESAAWQWRVHAGAVRDVGRRGDVPRPREPGHDAPPEAPRLGGGAPGRSHGCVPDAHGGLLP